MAVQIPQGFIIRSPEAIDDRLVLSKAQMRDFSRDSRAGNLPSIYFCVCSDPDDGDYNIYVYNRNGIPDPSPTGTGKFVKYAGSWDALANKPKAGDGIDPVALELPTGAQIKVITDSSLGFTSEGKLKVSDSFLERLQELNDAIQAEVERATSEEDGLKKKLDSEGLRIDDLVSALAAEIARAQSSEGFLRDTKQDKLTAGDGIEITNSEVIKVKYNDDLFQITAGELDLKLGKGLRADTSEGLSADVDGRTIVLDNTGKIGLPIDNESVVIINSEGHLDLRVDDDTIKIDSEGHLYATATSPAVDEKLVTFNSAGEITLKVGNGLEETSEGLAVKVDDLIDNESIKANSEGKLYVSLADIIDNETIKVDSEDKLAVDLAGIIDDETVKLNSEGKLKVALDDLVDDNTIKVNSEGKIGVALDDLVDADTVKLDSEGKLFVDLNVVADNDTILYDTSEDYLRVNFDKVQRKLVVDNGLKLTSEGTNERLKLLYDALILNNSEITIDVRGTSEGYYIYTKDVLYAGPNSARGTLRDIIPTLAGTMSMYNTSERNQLVDYDTFLNMLTSSLGTFRGTYDSEGALEAAWPYSSEGAQKNDYAFVTYATSEGTYYDRYKCVDKAGDNWEYEFRIATSAFTAPQWKALESLATKEDISDLKAHIRDVVTQTATTTKEAYKFTHDTQGHITSKELYNPNWVTSVTNRTVAIPTTSDIIKTVPFVKQGSDTGKTAIIMNSDSNSATGQYSVAEGVDTIAEGYGAHAEGAHSKAMGFGSHAEGYGPTDSEGSVASGQGSHAEGFKTSASGNYSHTEGGGTTASGQESHAEGYYTQATGSNSHAEGNRSVASNSSAHAEGWLSTASGYASHAEGWHAAASGWGAHAEGYSIASGAGSHAEGGLNNSMDGSLTRATGASAHAEGVATEATGRGSHAEGVGSIATKDFAHAEGLSTIASGKSAHAEGYQSSAEKDYSHAEGYNTNAGSDYQHVQGKYNVKDSANKYVDIVGWGTSGTTRKNISALTTEGELHLAKEVYINSPNADASGGLKLVPALTSEGHVLTIKTMPTATSAGELEWKAVSGGGGGSTNADWPKSVNNRTQTSNWDPDVIKTVPFVKQGSDSGKTAVIMNSDNTASGAYSLAIGQGNSASMPCTFVGGYNNTVSGQWGMAYGAVNEVSGGAAAAFGTANTVSGTASFAAGRGNTTTAASSLAFGGDNESRGENSVAFGHHTIASTADQFVRGRWNVTDSAGNYADIVGWGMDYGSTGIRKNISSLTTAGDLHIKQDFYFQSNNDGSGGYKLPYTVITTTGTGAQTLDSAKRDHIYIYPGPITSLTVSAIEKTDAITDIIFTAGSSITVTLPSGVKLPEGFAGFQANKTYEINILYNLATVTSWS